MPPKKDEDIKFEKGLDDLEKLVDELESGEVELDAALKKFEKGVKLTQALQKKLEASQRKVKKLIKNADGEAVEQDFDSGDDAAQDTLF